VIIEVLRAVPPVVWLFIVYYVLGSGTIGMVRLKPVEAAIIGLGAIYTAYIAEVYRGALDAIPAGQWDALRALGMPRIPAYRRVLAPQGVVLAIPPMATYGIALFKDGAIASIIGVTGITFQAVQLTNQTLNGLANFAVAGAFYIILCTPFALASRVSTRILLKRVAV
jgi:polar amino acid transport system permease protein